MICWLLQKLSYLQPDIQKQKVEDKKHITKTSGKSKLNKILELFSEGNFLFSFANIQIYISLMSAVNENNFIPNLQAN